MGEMQMQKAKYTAEFKEEAVRQVIDRGHSVIDVAKRLGIGDGLLYTWVKKFKAANEPVAIDDMKSMQAELTHLKASALTPGFVKRIMRCNTHAQECYQHDRQNHQRTLARGALQPDRRAGQGDRPDQELFGH
jgi:transposase